MNTTNTRHRFGIVNLDTFFEYVLPVVIGVGAMVLSAQISVRTGLSPVPITGQTLGVLLVAMILGRTRGTAAVTAYVVSGMMGAPVFAEFSATSALWGTNAGYIYGFIPMAYAAGWLADKGFASSISKATITGILAHVIVLAAGACVLSGFVGVSNMWYMGVYPFIIGSLLKAGIAGLIVPMLRKTAKS